MTKKEKKNNTNTIFSVCVISSSILNVRLEFLLRINYVLQSQKGKDGTEHYQFYIFIFSIFYVMTFSIKKLFILFNT